MIPEDRLQQLLKSKNHADAQHWGNKHGYSEGWALIDGALVVYNLDNPPWWLPKDEDRDEDGNTQAPAVA